MKKRLQHRMHLALIRTYEREIREGMGHGLINYQDYKTTVDVVFTAWSNRVYRLKIQSVMLVFSTQLCELLPSNLLSCSPPTPPPSQSQSTLYTDILWFEGGGGCRVVLETIFCKCLIYGIAFHQSNLSAGWAVEHITAFQV
jgi:hypothetical protein